MSITGDRGEMGEKAALRARQGVGARYDAPEAPVDNLLLARRGTAYFARLLNDLPDRALVDKCHRDGWTRARLIATVGYHARGLARLLETARTGLPCPDGIDHATEVALGASLPARALRGLFQHSAVHLDVEWRDLPGPAWDASLRDGDGNAITARDTPLIRARVIWRAALDLDAEGRAADLPPSLR